MKVGYRKLGLALGAVVAFALLPASADAQFVRYSPVFWSFEGSGGIALPMGDLGDVAESGASFQLAGSYFLNPRLALRAEGGMSDLGAKSGNVDPELRIWTANGGFEYHITDPTGSGMVAIDFGAGAAIFDTKAFTVQSGGTTTTQAFNKTYLGANVGIKLGYNFARHSQTNVPMATIFIQGDLDLMFADEADTAILASTAGQPGFGTVFQIPVRAGIRINIP